MKIAPVALAKRCERWQQRLELLGIGHFRFEQVTIIGDEDDMPGAPGAAAAAITEYTYDNVRMYFSQDFLDEADARELDEVIIHEWIHVAMRDFDRQLRMAGQQFSPSAFAVWDSVTDAMKETLIDNMAKTLYAAYNTDRK